MYNKISSQHLSLKIVMCCYDRCDDKLFSRSYVLPAEQPLSKLELMAKMRDMKRRRQSYRGKNTHTANKNYTEVLHH